MGSRIDSIVQQRLDKLQEIRQKGIDPYPPRYHRTHTTKEAVALFEQSEAAGQECPSVTVAGRIVSLRPMGKATFLDIRDGSGKVQVYLRADAVGSDKCELLGKLDIGDFIGVTGILFRTRTGEVTAKASDLTLLAKSLQPLPEKWHGLVDVEKRYRQRYLDLISNDDARRVFEIRSKAITAVRRFLDERGYNEVETPVLHTVAGGARAKPFITHHEALDQDLYLRIATELYLKRLIIGDLDKVYEIGRVFRNEGISPKHNPEFTMLECYEAYADYHDMMKMFESMVVYVAQTVLGTTKVNFGGKTIDFTPPWRQVTLQSAVKGKCGLDFLEYTDASALRAAIEKLGVRTEETLSPAYLIDKLVSTFVEPDLVQPTFLLDFPAETTPLAKRKPEEKRLVERFEAFVGGIEIANAFTELNDPVEQAKRFAEQEEWRARYGDEEAERYQADFVLAMEHGMPPTGGLGVGIDRLVMLLTDQQSIREVILFPQLRTK